MGPEDSGARLANWVRIRPVTGVSADRRDAPCRPPGLAGRVHVRACTPNAPRHLAPEEREVTCCSRRYPGSLGSERSKLGMHDDARRGAVTSAGIVSNISRGPQWPPLPPEIAPKYSVGSRHVSGMDQDETPASEDAGVPAACPGGVGCLCHRRRGGCLPGLTTTYPRCAWGVANRRSFSQAVVPYSGHRAQTMSAGVSTSPQGPYRGYPLRRCPPRVGSTSWSPMPRGWASRGSGTARVAGRSLRAPAHSCSPVGATTGVRCEEWNRRNLGVGWGPSPLVGSDRVGASVLTALFLCGHRPLSNARGGDRAPSVLCAQPAGLRAGIERPVGSRG